MHDKHSPGPWVCAPFPNPNYNIVLMGPHGTKRDIATVMRSLDDVGVANARLVAAAPDLLEACKAALAYVPTSTESGEPHDGSAWDCCEACAAMEKLRAALAKAEGSPNA